MNISMANFEPGRYKLRLLLWLLGLTLTQLSVAEEQGDPFWSALSKGKFDFSARYRYEHVDDDNAVNDADASTIRTTLGYTSAGFHGFGMRLLGQDVRDVFVDDFNDATGRPSSKTQFPVVADPSETDFLEAYLSYSGLQDSALEGTTFKLGRQLVTYRKAPFTALSVMYCGDRTGRIMMHFLLKILHYLIRLSSMPIPGI